MFALHDETVDQALERARAARVRRVRELSAERARIDHELTEISRAAGDAGDWQAVGCASGAAWLAQASSGDYSAAKRLTKTAEALRDLPALDEALSTGTLTFDQVAAATPYATAATDGELARLALGKAPSQIALVARTLAPPKLEDDAELYRNRALRTTWTKGNRELAIHARLPLEQGLAFERVVSQATCAQRADDKRAGIVLEWQQSAADALVTLVTRGGSRDHEGVQRSQTTVIVHLSDDDTPPLLEGAGPISRETADLLTCDARRLTIKRHGDDLVHSRVGRSASFAQRRALFKRSDHCQYPGCTTTRKLDAHHIHPVEHGGKTALDNLLLLCQRHHKHLHDHHIHAHGPAEQPTFSDASRRAITANQPHAPPG
jgi:hypothetical protein